MNFSASYINYSTVPAHCRDGLQLYIERGVPTGDFLKAILTNNLVEAYKLADDINFGRIADYAKFLYWECPSLAWGSEEKVATWTAHGGLMGLIPTKEQNDNES
jgi:hypothetical protein